MLLNRGLTVYVILYGWISLSKKLMWISKTKHFFLLQQPWVVSIQTPEGYLHCGGSIAASNRIITAAHCFTDQGKKQKMSPAKIRSFRIVAGTDKPFEFHGE